MSPGRPRVPSPRRSRAGPRAHRAAPPRAARRGRSPGATGAHTARCPDPPDRHRSSTPRPRAVRRRSGRRPQPRVAPRAAHAPRGGARFARGYPCGRGGAVRGAGDGPGLNPGSWVRVVVVRRRTTLEVQANGGRARPETGRESARSGGFSRLASGTRPESRTPVRTIGGTLPTGVRSGVGRATWTGRRGPAPQGPHSGPYGPRRAPSRVRAGTPAFAGVLEGRGRRRPRSGRRRGAQQPTPLRRPLLLPRCRPARRRSRPSPRHGPGGSAPG